MLSTYLLGLIVSTSIFFLLWIGVIQQLCMRNMMDKKGLTITVWITWFGSLCPIGNVVNYLSALYPDFYFHGINLSAMANAMEALITIIGFYVYRIFIITLIARMYAPTHKYPPKWYTCLFDFTVIFMIIATLICYSFIYIFHNDIWKYIYYIILSVVIFILAGFFASIFFKLLNILSNQDISNRELIFATRAMKLALFGAIAIDIICIAFLIFNVEIIFHFLDISFNITLINLIIHSIKDCALIVALLVLNYENTACCRLNRGTVYDLYGCYNCAVYINACCYYTMCCKEDRNDNDWNIDNPNFGSQWSSTNTKITHVDNAYEILLQESTKTSSKTNNISSINEP